MTPEDDWTDLSDAWTAPAGDDGGRPALARQVRRRALLGRINFYAEIAICGAACMLGGWLLAFGDGGDIAMGAAVILFGLFAVALTLWARGSGALSPLDTPQQALAAAIRQAEAGRRWAQAGVAVTIAAAAFGGVMTALTPSGPWPIYIGVGVLLLGCLAFQLRHHARCGARIRAHHQALEALNQGEAA